VTVRFGVRSLGLALLVGLLCFWLWYPEVRGAAPLDLTKYKLVFSEEFAKSLDISSMGPGTRWIAHTPWRGDFGDSIFTDPAPGFPFVVKNGLLRIEARKSHEEKPKPRDVWRSGLLSTGAPDGSGFALQYGYFEISAKLPVSPGVWPAFWLATAAPRPVPDWVGGVVEIDILEYYGFTGNFNSVVHTWKPEPHTADAHINEIPPKIEGTGFHRYGAEVTPEWVIIYFDRAEVWRSPTPKAHTRPLMILLNLALGGGWPIDKVPNPTFMYVDYVRAYAPK
jgi:Glycosyl hydrolases family 16